MKTPLERTIEKKVAALAKKRGFFTCKFVSPASPGVPDRVFVYGGSVVFVEFKRKGQKPTERQLAMHAAMRKAGAVVDVFDNAEDAMTALNFLADMVDHVKPR